jgi:hypothetical protein
MAETEITKSRNGLFMLMSIPIILQTSYFAILLIQQTESTTFRLFIGFVGIGLTIVPFLLNRNVKASAAEKSFFKINITAQTGLVIDIVAMLVITIAPWIPIFQYHAISTHAMTWVITPGSVMALSSSILAFSIAGIIVFLRNMNKNERALTIIRLIILLACVMAVLKIYIPTLLLFLFRCSVLAGSPQIDIFQSAISGHFWQVIVMSISDIITWQVCFLISFYFQFRFYKRWIVNAN